MDIDCCSLIVVCPPLKLRLAHLVVIGDDDGASAIMTTDSVAIGFDPPGYVGSLLFANKVRNGSAINTFNCELIWLLSSVFTANLKSEDAEKQAVMG